MRLIERNSAYCLIDPERPGCSRTNVEEDDEGDEGELGEEGVSAEAELRRREVQRSALPQGQPRASLVVGWWPTSRRSTEARRRPGRPAHADGLRPAPRGAVSIEPS